MQRLLTFALAATAAMSSALSTAQAAEPTAETAAIAQVLLYPGGAQVDRTVRVSAGATQARFPCLAPNLDRDALQIHAPPGVNLGELKLERVARDSLPECRVRDPRVRDLEKQRGAVEADMSGVDIALGYLKGLSDREAKPGPGLSAGIEALRRNAQDLVSRQQVLKERLQELNVALNAALAAQPASTEDVSVATLRLSTTVDAQVGLSYRLSRSAGWQPQYRARLDTATGALAIERLARIGQTSGEDWIDVKLKISTVQPRQSLGAAPQQPWRIGIQPPASRGRTRFDEPAPVAEPAPMALSRLEVRGSAVQPLNFDPSVFDGEFGTEYDLPQRITLRSNGQYATVSLSRLALEARLLAQVQPSTEAAAYLVAEVPRPQGSWPGGTMQMFRDGNLIGEMPLLLGLGQTSTWALPFGRDERLRVRVDPEKRDGADTGLIGTRRERMLTRQWEIENLRGRAVTLRVLEAAPVSEHEDVRVQTQFTPPVTQANWREQPGIQMWELPLAPNQTQRFQAVYKISVPKDAAVSGMP
nr:DUF4139 domain-containing protein [uncultured Roseateles sp.]